jgi:hypothetical protein
MAQRVFQVQAKDSVVLFNAFPALNAVQNLNLDPVFNEEYLSELGNEAYAGVSRQPETSGSFDVTSTGATASILARMIFNYTTQEYLFDPSTQGNNYTITETDFEYAVFDLLNLKQPGESFSEATLVPNALLTGFTLTVDAAGTASETYNFEADLQEAFAAPYHDMISVPLTTVDSGTAQVPAAYSSVDSGTYNIMYVFRDNDKAAFDDTAPPIWVASDTIATGLELETGSAKNRVTGILFKRTPGTFPTIYYPTSARFMRGDRIDIWLVNSGVQDAALNDENRLLRCQSADINVDLTRDRLQEIKRNDDNSTTYWRGLNFPLTITATVNILETTLQQWASLQNKTINESATTDTIDTNNIVNLADFIAQRLIIKYYPTGSDTPICTVKMDNIEITTFGEAQQVQGRAERTLGFTGSEITIDGDAG